MATAELSIIPTAPSQPQPQQQEDEPHFAFVRVELDGDELGTPAGHEARPEWFAACARLTTRAERLSDATALLALGPCTDAEALAAVSGLVARLAQLDIGARAGVGSSGCLAELALLCAPRHVAQRLLSSTDTASFLHNVPVGVISRLSCAREVTPATIERLRQYGLRTFGQVARLGELALRRQFGAHIGALLAAIVRGRDPRPLSPTLPAASLRMRLRISTGAVESARLPAVLSQFVEQVARQLYERGQQARTMRLVVLWESGARHQMALTLQRPTDEHALLLDALWRLLRPHLTSTTALAALWLTLSDFAPTTPEQGAFWRTRSQRLNAIRGVADTLARRHSRPLVLSARLSAPDAVFHEEQHTLHSLDTTGSADATSLPGADARRHALPRMDGQQDVWRDVPHRLHWW